MTHRNLRAPSRQTRCNTSRSGILGLLRSPLQPRQTALKADAEETARLISTRSFGPPVVPALPILHGRRPAPAAHATSSLRVRRSSHAPSSISPAGQVTGIEPLDVSQDPVRRPLDELWARAVVATYDEEWPVHSSRNPVRLPLGRGQW